MAVNFWVLEVVKINYELDVQVEQMCMKHGLSHYKWNEDRML